MELIDNSLAKGHRKRLRDRYVKNGIESFNDYEVLELLLTYAIPRKDVKNIAKELLKNHNSLFNIFHAKDLNKIEGLGNQSVVFLNLIGDLVIGMCKTKLENTSIFSEDLVIKTKDVLVNYIKGKIAYSHIENFLILFLNNANKLIATEKLFCGTIDKSAVYPREIVEKVIEHKAKGVIFAHNHPSGNIKPSNADIKLTKHMKDALNLIDVLVLDHIIISRDSYYSFLEEGLM